MSQRRFSVMVVPDDWEGTPSELATRLAPATRQSPGQLERAMERGPIAFETDLSRDEADLVCQRLERLEVPLRVVDEEGTIVREMGISAETPDEDATERENADEQTLDEELAAILEEEADAIVSSIELASGDAASDSDASLDAVDAEGDSPQSSPSSVESDVDDTPSSATDEPTSDEETREPAARTGDEDDPWADVVGPRTGSSGARQPSEGTNQTTGSATSSSERDESPGTSPETPADYGWSTDDVADGGAPSSAPDASSESDESSPSADSAPSVNEASRSPTLGDESTDFEFSPSDPALSESGPSPSSESTTPPLDGDSGSEPSPGSDGDDSASPSLTSDEGRRSLSGTSGDDPSSPSLTTDEDGLSSSSNPADGPAMQSASPASSQPDLEDIEDVEAGSESVDDFDSTRMTEALAESTQSDAPYEPDSFDDRPEHIPALAALLSMLAPGAGQIYNGEADRGWTYVWKAFLLLPWFDSVRQAYRRAEEIRAYEAPPPERGSLKRALLHVPLWCGGIASLVLLVLGSARLVDTLQRPPSARSSPDRAFVEAAADAEYQVQRARIRARSKAMEESEPGDERFTMSDQERAQRLFRIGYQHCRARKYNMCASTMKKVTQLSDPLKRKALRLQAWASGQQNPELPRESMPDVSVDQPELMEYTTESSSESSSTNTELPPRPDAGTAAIEHGGGPSSDARE